MRFASAAARRRSAFESLEIWRSWPGRMRLRRRMGNRSRHHDRRHGGGSATNMITIYHLETSRSERIVWLMEELGLAYKMEVFPRETTGAAPHPLKSIHPLGKAPTIRDGDTELADGPWFAGTEFTAADVMMVFPFTTLRYFLDYDLAPYANIAAYLKRIEARPAYQKAMSLAGPKKSYV